MSEHETQASEHEVPTERDRVAGSLIAASLVATAVAVAASVFVVWLFATRLAQGGGRSDYVEVSLEPPADPFDQPTLHELARRSQIEALDHWTWADVAHTRVRMPVEVAIDRYLAGGGR